MTKDFEEDMDRQQFFQNYFTHLPVELKIKIFNYANEGIWKKPESLYTKTDVITYKMHIKRKIIANIPKGLCQSDVQPNPLGPLIVTNIRWCKKYRCYVYNYNYGRMQQLTGEAKEHEVEKSTIRHLNNHRHYVIQ